MVSLVIVTIVIVLSASHVEIVLFSRVAHAFNVILTVKIAQLVLLKEMM